MEKEQLKKPDQTPPVEQKEIEAFLVPAKVMDTIYSIIGQKSWFEVNDIMTSIRTSIKPIFKESKTVSDEEKN